MDLLDKAMACRAGVISVMGDHAGEDVATIFNRKIADIKTTGRTFWLVRSAKARCPEVQEICRSGPAYVIFVGPATPGGARPTTAETVAREYSADRRTWQGLPDGLGPVTGKLDAAAVALVFDAMETSRVNRLDLWSYADYFAEDKPLRFRLGCSTVCAVRRDMTANPDRMKSRYRPVVAVARLAEPYGVLLR